MTRTYIEHCGEGNCVIPCLRSMSVNISSTSDVLLRDHTPLLRVSSISAVGVTFATVFTPQQSPCLCHVSCDDKSYLIKRNCILNLKTANLSFHLTHTLLELICFHITVRLSVCRLRRGSIPKICKCFYIGKISVLFIIFWVYLSTTVQANDLSTKLRHLLNTHRMRKPKLKRRESKEGQTLACHNISEPTELKETNLYKWKRLWLQR